MLPGEFEVAETVKGAVPYVSLGIALKARVGVAPVTLKLVVAVTEV
jgi:hypothetical protein